MTCSRFSHARVRPVACAWLVALVVAACIAAPVAAQPPGGEPASPPSEPPVFTAPAPVGVPLRVRIPAIEVNTAVERVGLLPDNTPGTPQDYANTAWFEGSARPGEIGNAVLNGHVDSVRGPAVFYRLPQLRVGDRVYVTGDDGVERAFAVRGVERYGPDDAPLGRIFGQRTDGVFLNLITCDNATAFNRRTASYTGYVTVYTELLAS